MTSISPGVGMPATLFDTRQIEVLRGPQGTAYGANALAGLINVRTEDPGTGFEVKSEITGATYDTRSAGLAWRRPRLRHAGCRMVAQQYPSDGFRHDEYLDRNSTNGFDEGTLRGKLHWQVADALQADLTLMHVDINNGYDAWSIYNTYTTYSNQPGRDAQFSNGAALRLNATLVGVGELHSVTEHAPIRKSSIPSTAIGATIIVGPVRALRLLPKRRSVSPHCCRGPAVDR